MNGIVIPILYMLAGVMVYAVIYHFAIALNSPRGHVQMLVAGMCLFTIPYALFHAQTLQATTPEQFAWALKLSLAALMPFVLLFSWFIALYTGKRPQLLLAGLTVLFAVAFAANLMQPYSLQYDHLDGIHTLHLPWGETVTRGDGHHGPWTYITVAGIAVLFGYALYALGSVYRRYRRRTDLFMLVAVGLFLFATVEGVLVRLSVVEFIETGPLGILVMAIVMSVTLAYETEQRVRDSEQFFRSLFENSPTGMVAVDPKDYRIVQANPVALNMIGYSAEEILAKTFLDLTHPDDLAESVQRNERLLNGLAEHLSFEKRYLKKDGSSFLAQVWVSPLKDSNGNVVRIIGNIVDISERKLTEDALHESEEKLRSLYELSPLGIALTEMNGSYVEFNESFRRICGYTESELKALDYWALTPKKYEADEARQLESLERTGNYGPYEKEYIRKDGSLVPLRLNGALVTDHEGHKRIWSIVEDITESRQTEGRLRVAAIAFESQEGMLITDSNGIILQVNRAFTDITGYAAEEAIGKNPRMLSSGRHNAAFYDEMWESVNYTGTWQGEIWNRRKNGEIYPENFFISAVKDKHGMVTNYVSSFSDSTASHAATEEIKHLAFYDALTDLPNRRLLLDRLKQAMVSSASTGKRGALLFIDLDNFKVLNDSLGHSMGDLLLQQVAQRLLACMGEGGTVARLGGDEFVVMLEDLSEQVFEATAQAKAVGERVLAALGKPFQLASHKCRSTPSMGITLFVDSQPGIDELFKQADIAMYQAKKAGRNTLRFFDLQMQNTVNARAALEDELHDALEQQQFHLYFQIQVDDKHRPLGAEALIRWEHPEHGLVFPDQFIPLAEETDMILPIGQWVLETACGQIKAWEKDALTRDLALAVNVSAMQFCQADFVDQIRSLVQRHAINPQLLKLELTESMLLENIEDTIVTMSALKEFGVRFSLDDFGTGYSSLQYLKRLPLDQLKIDQSFIRNIAVDSSDKAIVGTIITMAMSLHIGVIAEGVETEEQRQILWNKGCEHYQGYLFGRPMPIEQFEELLQQRQA